MIAPNTLPHPLWLLLSVLSIPLCVLSAKLVDTLTLPHFISPCFSVLSSEPLSSLFFHIFNPDTPDIFVSCLHPFVPISSSDSIVPCPCPPFAPRPCFSRRGCPPLAAAEPVKKRGPRRTVASLSGMSVEAQRRQHKIRPRQGKRLPFPFLRDPCVTYLVKLTQFIPGVSDRRELQACADAPASSTSTRL